jgi:hypothetical protein
LLTDDHPDTGSSYDNLAANLDAQGKRAQAQPLHEKALEIRGRLLSGRKPNGGDDDRPLRGLSVATGQETTYDHGTWKAVFRLSHR